MVSLVKEEKFEYSDAISFMYNALCTDLKAVALLTRASTIDELPQDLILSSARSVVRSYLINHCGRKGKAKAVDENIEKLVKLLVGYLWLQIDQTKNLVAAQKEMDAAINSILK
jgi:hypothetical protein